MKQGKSIVYAEYETTGNMVQTPPVYSEKVNCKESTPNAGLRLGCGIALLLYLLFGPIIVLTKKYMKKK